MKDELLEKLGDVIEGTISKFFTMDRLLLMLIEDKTKNLGVSLTESQKRKFVKLIQKSDSEQVTIQPNWRQKAQLKKLGIENINIEITEEDFENLETRINHLVKDVSESTLQNTINSTTDTLVREWKKQAKQLIRKLRNERNRFNNYNKKVWGEALSLLEAFIDISLDTGMLFNEKYRSSTVEENSIVFDVLARLHARACQVSTEILILLTNGFADGAHARWRTLHELSVIALFISHHDNQLAERYLDHSIVADYRRAIEYRKYSDSLSYSPMSDEVFSQMQSDYKAALTKHGENFKNDYGWASIVLNKEKPSFADIEEKTGILHMRPFVKLAHMNIHAGSLGAIFRLGSPPDDPNLLIAGASVYGIGEPAQNTIYSLELITETFFLTKPIFENLGFVLAFRKFMQDAVWEFDKAMEKQEKENSK